MTDLQIQYQNLLLNRSKTEKELALEQARVDEVQRHNLVTEQVAQEQNKIAWHQAESARINASASMMNAGSNRMNAETNRLNYYVNEKNAETNRLNYYVNEKNAQTNAWNAAINAQNAATNAKNAETNRLYYSLEAQYQPFKIAETRARTANDWAQTKDLNDKTANEFWKAQSKYYRAKSFGESMQAVGEMQRIISGYYTAGAQLTKAQIREYLDKHESDYWASVVKLNKINGAATTVNTANNVFKTITGMLSPFAAVANSVGTSSGYSWHTNGTGYTYYTQ